MPVSDALTDLNNALSAAPSAAPTAPSTPAPQSGIDAALADIRNIGAGDGTSVAAAPKEGGIARNLAAGANEAIASLIGGPVDAATWALNKLASPFTGTADSEFGEPTKLSVPPSMRDVPQPAAAQPLIQNPVGGSQSIESAMGTVGADPRNVGANDAVDRVARGTGAGVASMVAPTAAARTLVSGLAPGVTREMVQSLADVGLPTGTAVGAGSGFGGSTAAEVVPDQYKPLAELGGQLVGGGAVGGALAGVRALANVGLNTGRNLVGPFIPGVANDMAAEKLLEGASNPEQFRETVSNNPETLVPGSQPTTYQLTGDSGIGQLERAGRTQNPAPFLDRAAAQNAARTSAVEGLAPENANPVAVGDLFRQKLALIDEAGDAAVEGARQNALQALAGVGGQQSAQELGAAMRDQLEAGKALAKAQERALWQAIDPQGNLSINGAPVQQAAQEIAGEMPQTARPMDGEEANIFKAAQSLGPQSSFQDFAALRSRTLDAIRNEAATNGQSQSWRRMQMLRGAMDDTMADAASGVAQQQAQDVAAGRLSPEDTMATALARLAQDAQAHYVAQDARVPSAIQQLAAGGRGGGNIGAGSPGRAPGAISTSGEGQPPAERPGVSPGNPSLQSQAQALASVPFNAAAGERYRAAADATRDRAQTFNNPQVGPVLQERGGMYRLGESQVPQRAIGSPEGTQAFLNAGVQPGTMQDALVADLRQAATNPDGTLNVGRYQTWLRNRGPALQNFPDLQQRLGDAASAQEAVDATSARAKAQSDAYQQSAAQYFLKAEPRQAVTAAFGSKTPQTQNAFSQLARLTSASPDAQAGLQRAIIDHMMSATQNPQGEFTPAAFGKYLATRRPALAAVFSPDQLSTMDAVAADLQRSNLSISGSKIPGSPGTAQDLAAARSSLLGNIVRRVAGAGAGYAFGGLHGAIEGALGGEAANAVRRAGLDQINKLVEDALLNPERARALLADYTRSTAPPIATRVRNAYGGATLASLLTPENTKQEPNPPAASPLAAALAGVTSARPVFQPAAP